MSARRRYVLSGEPVTIGGANVLRVKVRRGKVLVGHFNVRHVGTPSVSAECFGLEGLPSDHFEALALLASRGFLGAWSPTVRAPSSSPSGLHHTPLTSPTSAPSR